MGDDARFAPGSSSLEQGERADCAKGPLSLSFSGSGFLVIYQIGAVRALRLLAPELLRSANRVYGASAGSLIAAAVVCECSLDDLQTAILEAAQKAQETKCGLLFSSFKLLLVVRKVLSRFLPTNAHQLASGRLHIALTRLSDGKNVLVSDYSSKEELIQALICSCFIPFYCGFIPPKFRGVVLHHFQHQGYQDGVHFLRSNSSKYLKHALPESAPEDLLCGHCWRE